MFEVTNISKRVIDIFDKSYKPMQSYTYKDVDYTDAIANKVNLLCRNNFMRVDYHQDVIDNIEEPVQIIDEPIKVAVEETPIEKEAKAAEAEEASKAEEEPKKRGRKKNNA